MTTLPRLCSPFPLAVRVVAAGAAGLLLAGCSLLAPPPEPTTPATPGGTDAPATSTPAGGTGAGRWAAIDPDGPGSTVPTDPTEPTEPTEQSVPAAESGEGSGVGDQGLADHWTLGVDAAWLPNDVTVRPPAPTPLIDYLPADSTLDFEGDTRPEFEQALVSDDLDAAAGLAMSMLTGAVVLVNEGRGPEFGRLAAASCGACMDQLSAAYDIHVGDGSLSAPWAPAITSQIVSGELTGPDHVLVQIDVEVDGGMLIYESRPGAVHVLGAPTYGFWQVEMLFEDGRWWVVDILG